jgi:chromate transporter
VKNIRNIIFLKDVLLLTLSAFGGPQAHLALFQKILVKKRAYISEEDLIELNSFCQILPGPASTQTLTAVGFKMGGPKLAFLTLLVWILPACIIMTLAAIGVIYWMDQETLKSVTRFIQPMAVAFVMYAAYRIGLMVVKTKTSYIIFVISAVFCFFAHTPAIFPIVLLIGGLATTFRWKKQQVEKKKESWNIKWANLSLFIGIFLGSAILSKFTKHFFPEYALPFGLFENFYRNGSLLFGGGDALSAFFYTEFVDFRKLLTEDQLLTGFALQKTLPGPLFAFSSYVGAIAMDQFGLPGLIIGGIIGAIGIFLPGTILIFFLIRIWDKLKQNRVVKASLEGINAASAGVVTATALVLFDPIMGMNTGLQITNIGIIITTICILIFTKIPPPYIILTGLIAGFIL